MTEPRRPRTVRSDDETVPADELDEGISIPSGKRTRIRRGPQAPRHVVILVHGTTQPVNHLPPDHDSGDYWSGYSHFEPAVEALTDRFRVHEIWWDFEWNGQNSVQERIEAGRRLANELVDHFSDLAERPVRMHFVGHSHGGQVINECVTSLDGRRLRGDWKVQTITYLSTPFFPRLHHLHARAIADDDLTLVNVFNEYDVTQRLIADFSVGKLYLLADEFQSQWEELREQLESDGFDASVFEPMSSWYLTKDEAEQVWIHAGTLATRLAPFLARVASMLDTRFGSDEPTEEHRTIVGIVRDLAEKANAARVRLERRRNRPWTDALTDTRSYVQDALLGFNRVAFVADVDLAGIVDCVERLLRMDLHTGSGPLLRWICQILSSDVLSHFDDTVVEPPLDAWELRARPRVLSIPVGAHDPYHAMNGRTCYRLSSASIRTITHSTDLRVEVSNPHLGVRIFPLPALTALQDEWYFGEQAFLRAIGDAIGRSDAQRNRAALLGAAQRRRVDFDEFAARTVQVERRLAQETPGTTGFAQGLEQLAWVLLPAFLEPQMHAIDKTAQLSRWVDTAEWLLTGRADRTAKNLRRSLDAAHVLLERGYVHIATGVVESDGDRSARGIEDHGLEYGSLPYLAVRAHSVSRMGLQPVNDAWHDALAAAGLPPVPA